MAIRLNRQLLDAHRFDSGALSLATSVAHRFTLAGRYRVRIRQNDLLQTALFFDVLESAVNTQLDIDLSLFGKKTVDEAARTHSLSLQPGGYLLLYTSAGSGYSAMVSLETTGKEVLFDTQRLSNGDVFALTILEPAKYKVNNQLGQASGHLTVSFSDKDAPRLRSLQTVQVETYTDRFDPSEILLVSTQGLVFAVQENARIVIEREGKRDKRSPMGKGRFLHKRPR